MSAAREQFIGADLPPLSREALKLRQELSRRFMVEADAGKRARLLNLILVADKRFERRELKYRAQGARTS